MRKYSKAKMFNRKAGRKKNKAEKILSTLHVQPGQTIADIGSGGGFFTILLSAQVGTNGKVYAVDTNKDFLEFITRQVTKQKITNITTVPATEHTIPLPAHSIDLIFARNVYHHLQNRIVYFSEAKQLLAPKGRVAIVEHVPEGSRLSFHRRCGHNVPKETIIQEMGKAGYRVSASFDFLPTQSFTIFMPSEYKKEDR
jgi:arsenite methyltransferase